MSTLEHPDPGVYPVTEPGVYADIPDAAYHADPVPGGSLSSTGAKRILDSPARYRWEQDHRVEKKAYDVGHAVHAKVLGVGMEIAEIPDEILGANGSASTKEAKAFIANARTEGKVPLKADEVRPINAMADAVLTHPLARQVLEREGQAEASLFAQDPATGVWLRARPDFMPEQSAARTILADLKTIGRGTANPRDFGREAASFGYHQQSAFYQDVIRLARGDSDTAFVFILVETRAPHFVSVVELTYDDERMGRERNARAIATYAECKRTGIWPGYEPIVHSVSLPRWTHYDHEEDYA